MEGNLLYLKFTHLSVNIIHKKHLHKNSQNMFDQISVHHGSVKLASKMNL